MTIKKDEWGWIEIAGGATSLNPKYWQTLSKEQKRNVLKITFDEMDKAHKAFDTAQCESYIDFRSDGDDHKTAIEKAEKI